MTLDEFAPLTLEVLSRDGVLGYQPVIVTRGQLHFVTPTGDCDLREAIQRTIERAGLLGEDLCFGVTT